MSKLPLLANPYPGWLVLCDLRPARSGSCMPSNVRDGLMACASVLKALGGQKASETPLSAAGGLSATYRSGRRYKVWARCEEQVLATVR